MRFKRYIGVVCVMTISVAASAQKMGRYHKNLLYEAEIYFEQGDYYYASELYTEVSKVAQDNGEVLGRLGICYFHIPPLQDQAERYLELAVDRDDTESLYYLAQKRIQSYRFFEAIDLLQKYEEKGDRMKSSKEVGDLIASAERAAVMVRNPVHVSIKNLGNGVNSSLHDYAPVWDAQGERLYFTSRRRYDTDSEKDVSEQYDENIYSVDLLSETKRAMAANEPLNSRTNDAAVACSEDGKSLILYRTRKNGFSGDLYITEKDGHSWKEPEKLNDQVNSKYHEASACFGNKEGTVLYFSSDRPDGFGGKDLYVVRKLPDGKWSDAQNLGPNINSAYDEDAPFISAKGNLYFASNGHETMGGYDIFCAIAEGETFLKPENLGYPINTPGDDVFFVMDKEGKQAYFSSERVGGYGLQDLYRIQFNDANTIIYRGKLVTIGDNIPPYATITLLNKDSGAVEGLYQADPKDGSFVLALNADQNYTVVVEADGFRALERPLYIASDDERSEDEVEKIILSK